MYLPEAELRCAGVAPGEGVGTVPRTTYLRRPVPRLSAATSSISLARTVCATPHPSRTSGIHSATRAPSRQVVRTEELHGRRVLQRPRPGPLDDVSCLQVRAGLRGRACATTDHFLNLFLGRERRAGAAVAGRDTVHAVRCAVRARASTRALTAIPAAMEAAPMRRPPGGPSTLGSDSAPISRPPTSEEPCMMSP